MDKDGFDDAVKELARMYTAEQIPGLCARKLSGDPTIRELQIRLMAVSELATEFMSTRTNEDGTITVGMDHFVKIFTERKVFKEENKDLSAKVSDLQQQRLVEKSRSLVAISDVHEKVGEQIRKLKIRALKAENMASKCECNCECDQDKEDNDGLQD